MPWGSVGPGWILAQWGPPAYGTPLPGHLALNSATVLYLVDPAGGRYRLHDIPMPPGGGQWSLDDWAGDGRHALFSIQASSSAPNVVADVDLATGKGREFDVPAGTVPTFAFTQPRGDDVLITYAHDSGPHTLTLMSPDGRTLVRYPSTFPGVGSFTGAVLPERSGSPLVLGTTGGLAVVTASGRVSSTVPVSGSPGDAGGCQPVSWWSTDTVLARCFSTSGDARLWRIPLQGGGPTQLSVPSGGTDQGDANAWRLPGGTFVQANGSCYQYLARLGPTGTTTPVPVPGVPVPAATVLGAYHGRLAVWAYSKCFVSSSLLWFDPARDTVQTLLGPPLMLGQLAGAVLFRDPTHDGLMSVL